MRKSLMLAALGLAGVAASAAPAAAYGYGFRPARGHTTLAAFPAVQPPGWYANRYYYQWQMPWFAYYGYQDGPYAGWMAGGGFATYEGLGHNQPNPPYPGYIGGPQFGVGRGTPGSSISSGSAATPTTAPAGTPAGAGTVSITLPTDAKLLFNGTATTATGATRTFRTPPLEAGREYAYDLTAEVVRDGRTVTATERVTVRAGQETKVTLTPASSVAAK